MDRRGFIAGLFAVPLLAVASRGLRGGRAAERAVETTRAAAIGSRAALTEIERSRAGPRDALEAADRAADAYDLTEQQPSPDITVTGRRPRR